MATSKLGYEEVETKEGGSEIVQCVRTVRGISSATYFLLSLSWPRQTSAGWETTGSYPLAERQPNQPRTSHHADKDLVFLYISGVQNLKHSEATFALFFPSFSPCQTHSYSLQSPL